MHGRRWNRRRPYRRPEAGNGRRSSDETPGRANGETRATSSPLTPVETSARAHRSDEADQQILHEHEPSRSLQRRLSGAAPENAGLGDRPKARLQEAMKCGAAERRRAQAGVVIDVTTDRIRDPGQPRRRAGRVTATVANAFLVDRRAMSAAVIDVFFPVSRRGRVNEARRVQACVGRSRQP